MKITNKYISYFALLLSVVVIVSCEDDDKDFIGNSITKDAAFVRFDENPPTALGLEQVSDLAYSFRLLDGNNNVASYDLKIYADLSGTRTDTVDVATVTSFPRDFSFDAQSIADLFGITVDEISFGDQFFFTGKATTAAGVEYGTETGLGLVEIFLQDDGTYLDADDDPITVGPDDQVVTTEDGSTFRLRGNNSVDEIGNELGYRAAYEFNFIILCPSVEFSEIIGTLNVTNHRFDAFFGNQGATREVVLGPGENQITIIGGALPLDGGADLILDIDPATSQVTYGGESGQRHFTQFGPADYASVEGLIFTCIGKLDITINSEGFIPNFLTLEAQ